MITTLCSVDLVFFVPDQGFQIGYHIDVEVILHPLAQMVLVGNINALLTRPFPQNAQQNLADNVTIFHVLE